ncbi:MAG: hypothetical protein V2A58_15080 [Planctomycetota bacterium]
MKRSLGCLVLVASLTAVVSWQAGAQDSSAAMQEYERRAGGLSPQDVAAHMELAAWCEQNGLAQEAKSLYEKVIALDPENRDARSKLGYRRVPPGRWLNEDEYHEYRGDVFMDGSWLTPQQWVTLVTSERRRKISPWSETSDGLRVDTQHFIILTDADETFARDVAEMAELSFMTFLDLMDCREVNLPSEVAEIGQSPDLSQATFIDLADDAGAHFILPQKWELTCWTSGAMLMRFPNGKEITRANSGALVMMGLDARNRLVYPFMTADNRIRLEVFQSREKWMKERFPGGLPQGDRPVLVPMTGERVVLWRALRGEYELQAKDMADEVYYYLVHQYTWFFAPSTPWWFRHAMGEYFARGIGYRGTINLKKYDKDRLAQAHAALSGTQRLASFLDDMLIHRAEGYNRLTSKDRVSFPVLYALACYGAQEKAAAKGQKDEGTVLQVLYRELAMGRGAQEAIEKASGGKVQAFQGDMVKWLARFSDSRTRLPF